MSASLTTPILIHGKRRIKQGMVEQFKELHHAYSQAMFATPGIKAVFAFPDPGDPLTFWNVVWSKDAATFDLASKQSAQQAGGLQLFADGGGRSIYASTPEDPDVFHAYGGWDEKAMQRLEGADPSPSVRFDFHRPMAGYMKQDGAGEEGPPLIGFTKRHVKPGRIGDLAGSFQEVCDLWHEKVPGILAATVSQSGDPSQQPNLVHDIRIFANHAAYQAHVDKSDPALTAAMETWFANYDTSLPFTGELYMPGKSVKDEGIRTSSIKDRPVKAGFSEFVYGQGMLGPMPNMTKDDDKSV